MNDDRQAQIDSLVLFTNKDELYFKSMSDEQVEEAYDRLMELD